MVAHIGDDRKVTEEDKDGPHIKRSGFILLGFRFTVRLGGLGLRRVKSAKIWGLGGCRMEELGFRVSGGLGFRCKGFGFRVLGLGVRV